ncbi:iron ABC transporter permease [Shewanella sp. D64]|uniref:FecCD family ABC transporter permease n=1 Tax=unclassified Shewanella TaxID=196818 RepID=UPI0022BA3A0C|nr:MULTISPECIES: iron ABC transporter permease [unclassified Shewanella]MEC4724994.1 iron ABC transporter permease [Shewanella sp. D64]MEC4736895.1 iron ABC transporter permease [Shewanella sp. E94]WBJ96492.1 iron ABC transporter permease [Shewanella sp. MTB7]
MENQPWLWPGVLSLLVITGLLSIITGPLQITPLASFNAVLNWATHVDFATVAPHEQLVINNVRLPRTILAMTVGAILAQCGAVMQGLFRNPLADPGIIGVSSGAALGAAICIVLLPGSGEYTVAFSAFLAGLITTLVVYRLASSPSGTSVVLLLLSGVAIAALAGAGIGLLTYLADDMALRDLTLWQMGSIAGAQWQYVSLSLLALVLISWQFSRSSTALNAMLLGEAEARHLGIEVDKLKLKLIVLCAIGVGISVAATGIIGFIGLVIPHLVRMVIGPDHKRLLPISAVLGAITLALADIGARSLVAPAELPVGLVTAMLGAPFFIFMLLKQKNRLI